MPDHLAVHSGRRLLRNVLLNFVGQGLPLIVALFALPAIIRGLGPQRFGAFQLGWVVLGYFALLDLGLGRATTKFVAGVAGRGETDQIPAIVAGAAALQATAGLLGAGLLAGAAPILVGLVFHVPPALAPEVTEAFRLLALGVPIVLVTMTFSGLLQALQRFDLVNLVQACAGIANYALPVVALELGSGLVGVVGVVLVVRLLALAAFVTLGRATVPALRRRPRIEWTVLVPLLKFGGWLTITNAAASLLVYFDRLVIGALLSLSAVAYYTAPYDVLARLAIIPASIIPPLFAAFSALEGSGRRELLGPLFARAAKLMCLFLTPVVLTVVLVARPALGFWLGTDFAQHSTRAAQILAVALAVNALAQLPAASLQGIGRADLTAKFQLAELPVYFGLLWWLIARFGIVGAALAWLIRAALDASLLYGVGLPLFMVRRGTFVRALVLRAGGPVLGFIAVAVAAVALHVGLLGRLATVLVSSLVFGITAWRYALEPAEREPLLALLRLRRRTAA